jgi:UDP-N-acetylglucosamine acyltransferase
VHQFCRIGRHCYIGGGSVVTQDVMPYSMTVSPREIKTFGVNKTGLERRGFATGTIERLQNAFRILTRSGLNTTQAIERIRREVAGCAELDEVIEFIRSSERGCVK